MEEVSQVVTPVLDFQRASNGLLKWSPPVFLMIAFFHLTSNFTIRDLTRVKIVLIVVVNSLETLVISTIASKLIFL